MVGRPQAGDWLEFWRLYEKGIKIRKPLKVCDDYFGDSSANLTFLKLGQDKKKRLPKTLASMLKSLPFLKGKWQKRYGIILKSKGLLCYFKSSDPDSLVLGCVGLTGAVIKEDIVQLNDDLFTFSLTSLEPRRNKDRGTSTWHFGAETEQECRALMDEIAKHI